MLKVSERRACRALGQHRSTQRKAPRGKEDEEQLRADLIELARQYGRYGYRKISALLRDAGWLVNNDKRMERIWRQEGLWAGLATSLIVMLMPAGTFWRQKVISFSCPRHTPIVRPFIRKVALR